MMARAAEKIGYERARTRVGQALLMNGVDHVEPHTAIPALIEKLSAVEDQRAHHSTLPAYVAAVRAAVESNRPELEKAALDASCYSARAGFEKFSASVFKMTKRFCANVLTAAARSL